MYCQECDVKMAYSRQDAVYICPLCGGEDGEDNRPTCIVQGCDRPTDPEEVEFSGVCTYHLYKN